MALSDAIKKPVEISFQNWELCAHVGRPFPYGSHGKVTRIEEHRARGDGDRWHYDVTLEDGEVHVLFSFDEVVWK